MLFALLAAELTDAQLIARSTAPFDRRAKMFHSEVLGQWRGHLVVADYPCSDLCPEYTVRIIHLAVPADEHCAAAGGRVMSEAVPMGIATGHQRFCVPAPIATPAVRARSPDG